MASERTPLLVEQGLGDRAAATGYTLPSLRDALRQLSTEQSITAKHVRDLVPETAIRTLSLSHQYAFFFAILLYLEASVSADRTSTPQHVSAVRRTVHTLTVELWTAYSDLRLDDANSQDVSVETEVIELLWLPILMEEEASTGPQHTSGKELL